MNWLVFLIVGVLAVAVDRSLGTVLVLDRLGDVRPSFVMPLLVFVALFADRSHALWACLLLGLLVDLVVPIKGMSGTDAFIPGPHALGFAFAGYLIVQVRSMLFRGRVLTIALMTLAAVIAAGLVTIFIYSVRSWLPGERLDYFPAGGAGAELVRMAGIGVYTALVTIVLGWLMLQTMPLWAFPTVGVRGRHGRY